MRIEGENIPHIEFSDSASEQSMLTILEDCVGQEVNEGPDWNQGSLALWYGGEWAYYDEYDPRDASGHGMGRYIAGAYLQTVALRPEGIGRPQCIGDALMRINQVYRDAEYIDCVVTGMQSPEKLDKVYAAAILFYSGDAGKAGHWPTFYDDEHFESEITEKELADLSEIDRDFYEFMIYSAHLRPMKPELLGSALAAFIDKDVLTEILQRLSTFK